MFDASALLAILREEAGQDVASSHLAGGLISTVNLSEVIARLVDLGQDRQNAIRSALALDLEPVLPSVSVALDAAALRAETRQSGLSLGDRFCIAHAGDLGVPALTADRAWARLDLGVEVIVIR
jgi:PIN domain nuclease of toxin-antitoxin system